MPLQVYTARVSYGGADALDISRAGADKPRPGVGTAPYLAPHRGHSYEPPLRPGPSSGKPLPEVNCPSPSA